MPRTVGLPRLEIPLLVLRVVMLEPKLLNSSLPMRTPPPQLLLLTTNQHPSHQAFYCMCLRRWVHGVTHCSTSSPSAATLLSACLAFCNVGINVFLAIKHGVLISSGAPGSKLGQNIDVQSPAGTSAMPCYQTSPSESQWGRCGNCTLPRRCFML